MVVGEHSGIGEMSTPGRVLVAGSINLDLLVGVDHHPRPGEEVTGDGPAFRPGGKGANQAVAAARAGASVTMIGALGDDAHAGELEAFLVANGIDISGVHRQASAATGLAIVVVDKEGENTIVAVPGANHLLAAESIAGCAPRVGDVLVAQLETPTATTQAFFQRARAAGAATLLNAAPALPLPPELLAVSDVLVVNEIELGVLTATGLGPTPDEATIRAAAHRLQRATGTVVVATLGSRGVLAVTGTAVHVVPGRPVSAVDTTGAGDCFVGNLAARLAARDTLEQGLVYANAAASLCVQRPGAGPSMPSAEETWVVLGSAAEAGGVTIIAGRDLFPPWRLNPGCRPLDR